MAAPANRVVSNVSALGRNAVIANYIHALDKGRAMYNKKEHQATWTLNGKALDEKSKAELRAEINSFALREVMTSTRTHSSFSNSTVNGVSSSTSSNVETTVLFLKDFSKGTAGKMWELNLTALTPVQNPLLTPAALGFSPNASFAISHSSFEASNPAGNFNWQPISPDMGFDQEDLFNVLNKNRIVHEGVEYYAILTKNHVKLDSKSTAELLTLMDTWDLTQAATSYRLEPDNSKTTIISYKKASAANAASAANEIMYRLEMTPLKPNETRLLLQSPPVVNPSATVVSATPASSAAVAVSAAQASPNANAAAISAATPPANPAILTAAALASAKASEAKKDKDKNPNPASAASAVSSASAAGAKSANDGKTPDKPAANAAVKPPVASTATAVPSKSTAASRIKWKG